MNRYGPTESATNLAACPRYGKHAGTDTIKFIFHRNKPKDIRATYVRAVCNNKPKKNRLTEQNSLQE